MDPAGSDQRIAVNRFTEWADLTRVGLGRCGVGDRGSTAPAPPITATPPIRIGTAALPDPPLALAAGTGAGGVPRLWPEPVALTFGGVYWFWADGFARAAAGSASASSDAGDRDHRLRPRRPPRLCAPCHSSHQRATGYRCGRSGVRSSRSSTERSCSSRSPTPPWRSPNGGSSQRLTAAATIAVWLAVAVGVGGTGLVAAVACHGRRSLRADALPASGVLTALSMIWADDAGRAFAAFVRVAGYIGLFTLVALCAFQGVACVPWLAGLVAGADDRLPGLAGYALRSVAVRRRRSPASACSFRPPRDGSAIRSATGTGSPPASRSRRSCCSGSARAVRAATLASARRRPDSAARAWPST